MTANKGLEATTFAIDIAGEVAHLRFNRPEKANSMTRAFWSELPRVVTAIDRGALARAIVISGEGKHFCSGMDLSVFGDGEIGGEGKAGGPDMARKAEAFLFHLKSLQDAFTCLDQARMPVIAAIPGACVGGAVDLVTACDIRYGAESTFFSIQETNIGMTADVGTFPRLCTVIPQGHVREMAYTGRRLTAARAREIGLLNETFPDAETTLAAALDLAREIATKSPVAVTGCKRMINYARDHSIDDTLDYVAVWNASMLRTEDMRLAIEGQMTKTTPRFQNLLVPRTGFE
ncbi:MAG: crotonase/enoyl-CoA hydratase family protein [Alphaproteobacteria bacterium]|nr:crotonase/enoyl-CoA hydratase family protein [Alphaproteobacteria bacterium]